MKIKVNLSRLWANANIMGAEPVHFDLNAVWNDSDIQFDNELSSTGVEVKLEDLESDAGLLSVRGRQVILFIPDHAFRIEKVMLEPSQGNKFHIADCKTLDIMRERKRFERYKVTNNLSGVFDIFGIDQLRKLLEASVELNVCKNCLNMLNYKNATTGTVQKRNTIVNDFSVKEFFSTYSSIFKFLPKQHINFSEKGYSDDWKNLSVEIRKKANYLCGSCGVDLSSKKNLLHVHHINGVKSDNSLSNLIVLCADCHKKEPYHGHLFIKRDDIRLINSLRKEQEVIADTSWDSVYKYADTALHGILNLCQKKNHPPPVVGYDLTDKDGQIIAEIELGWPEINLGIYLGAKVEVDGWRLINHKESLDYFK